jgi:aspartyl-tRNA(Asn)/glutamyl-tRNA(Gln) amidotransferase subunit B
MNREIETTNGYTPTIGLEVHAELKTATKMFCGCKNAPHDNEVNTHVCPICMAHPGTLPLVNKEAVQKVLDVGTAVGATLAGYTEFDRKNYFYPDIPKGYQISQFAYPLVVGGSLHNVALTRIHLEEDTARSSHEHGEGSIVDYNRAGVPLMELVTEPVIHDAETAASFGRELQLLLRELGVSDANMEKGEMRVEANISVSKDGSLGTKVEVKNLNSFKAVQDAIRFEVKRHIALLEKGEKVVQETRGWDENRSLTFSQRKKESSHDYRYFPDPDIPNFDTVDSGLISVSRQSDISDKIPSKIREKYLNIGLPSKQIEVLIDIPTLRAYFEYAVVQNTSYAKVAANYLTSDVVGLMTSGAVVVSDHVLSDHLAAFAELVGMVADGSVTSRVAKDLLPEVLKGSSAKELVASRGLATSSDAGALGTVVDQVIAANESVVAEYKAGKVASIQFLVGQCMKATKGAGNPAILRSLLEERINK